MGLRHPVIFWAKGQDKWRWVTFFLIVTYLYRKTHSRKSLSANQQLIRGLIAEFEKGLDIFFVCYIFVQED